MGFGLRVSLNRHSKSDSNCTCSKDEPPLFDAMLLACSPFVVFITLVLCGSVCMMKVCHKNRICKFPTCSRRAALWFPNNFQCFQGTQLLEPRAFSESNLESMILQSLGEA